MAQKMLTLDSLADLDDGRLRLLVNHTLDQLCSDIHGRGVRDRKPRVLVLRLALVPTVEIDAIGNAAVTTIDVVPQVTTKTPATQLAPTRCIPKRSKGADGRWANGALFNSASPRDPRQGTLDDLQSDRGGDPVQDTQNTSHMEGAE